MSKVPFMLVGDGPQEPTGLGRIARDLGGLLASSDLPIELVQIGGTCPPPWIGWRHFPLNRGEDWGAACVAQYWHDLFGRQPGILWLIWDPSRLYDYLQLDLPVSRWAYTAIDSANIQGRISGPAGEALRGCDRVLAYGRWASGILKDTLGQPISYLPHGLSLDTYRQPLSPEETLWTDRILGPHFKADQILVGCVATNQPRKDLSLFFATLAELKHRGRKVYGWLHTDVLVKAWSIQQLVDDFGLTKQITVTLDTFSDRQLACLYKRCRFTIQPGLGEGFGYGIVESLASGVAVLHGNFGGGVELVPKLEWRIPPIATRLDSVYALIRPVFHPTDWANAAERILQWQESVGTDLVRAYCQGTVAHLDWTALWPRWKSWIKAGL